MKILYITNNLSGQDGWSRYSLDIATSIKGVDSLWLVADKSDKDFKQEKLLSQPLNYLSRIFIILNTAKKINTVIRNFSPDVIHFLVEPYLMVLPLLKINNAKVVCTVHGTYSFIPNIVSGYFKRKLLLLWTKLVYKRINTLIAVSNYTKKYLVSSLKKYKFAFAEDNISVISNGINLKAFSNEINRKLPHAIKQILFVGAVKQRKGLEEAIKALKFYNDHYSKDFVFNIVGFFLQNDFYYLRLKSLINEAGLNNKVIFQNRVNESVLHNFYSQADLFLLLSIEDSCKFEGFGLVYLEANAYGVPCVGARHSGAEDAILDGRTGYLIEAREEAVVAEKIDLVLNKYSIDTDACLAWAKENDINIKVKELLQIYI